MSHAYGQVLFQDGTLMHFEYNGTSDYCMAPLRATAQEVSDNWRSDEGPEICDCPGEPCLIANDYGGGCWWEGYACREHLQICWERGAFDHWADDLREAGLEIGQGDGLPVWWEGDRTWADLCR